MTTQTKQERDIELLWQSAEHWLENFQFTRPENVSISYDACACCRAYYDSQFPYSFDDEICKLCPIKIETGEGLCFNTPYDKVHDLITIYRKLNRFDVNDLRKAILEEYKFLIDLIFKLINEL